MNDRVVLDTNVLLISLLKNSKHRPIFDGLLGGKFDMVITNEILSEYLEIIEQKTTPVIAANLCDLLLSLKNVIRIDVSYRWNLLLADPDDNKFTDCAIAANAKYLVSNDRHFDVLKSLDFPKLMVISSEQFLKDLKEKWSI